MCRDGFGVDANADFNVSSCLALIVVLGPRLFPLASSSSLPLDAVFLSSLSSDTGDESAKKDYDYECFEQKNRLKETTLARSLSFG